MDRLLSLIEERWKQLLGVIAEEHDPAQLREMITELSTILEERKEGAQNSEEIPSPPPKAKAQSPGRIG